MKVVSFQFMLLIITFVCICCSTSMIFSVFEMVSILMTILFTSLRTRKKKNRTNPEKLNHSSTHEAVKSKAILKAPCLQSNTFESSQRSRDVQIIAYSLC